MDTIHLNKNSNTEQNKKVSFTGYRNEYDSKGKNVVKFYTPPYDKQNYDISIEIFDYAGAVKNEDGQWKIKGKKLDSISPKEAAEKFKQNEPYEYTMRKGADNIAYRFVLKNKKDPNDIKYVYDAGNRAKLESGGEKEDFNVLFTKTGTTNKSGPMYHIFPDSYGVLKKDGTANSEENESFRRNHFNKAGGNIKNIINELNAKESELEPYSLIISTPLFGADEVSSHGYWTANPYQISSLKGDVNDFKNLINTMFDKGKGYVADGAFTSQTFEGTQMSNVLKWGKDSEFAGWFKLDPDPDSRLKLGVIPTKAMVGPEATNEEKKEARDLKSNLGVRIVNPKGVKGYTYDAAKPSYIQFYDKRMVTEDELKNYGELIKVTHKPNPENPYDVVNYEDSVQHFFSFDPDSDKLKKLPKDLRAKYIETGSLSLEDIEPTVLNTDSDEQKRAKGKAPGMKEFFSMPNYDLTFHDANGGSTCWDGQADLVKLNLSVPDSSQKSILGNFQAKNYMYNVASFWTRLSANSILEHISDNLSKDMDTTLKTIADEHDMYMDIVSKDGKKIGEKNILEDVKANVLNGSYENKILFDERKLDKVLDEEIANFPLESIEFATDLSASLSTSYITPRPTKNATEARADIVDKLPPGSIQSKLYKTTLKEYVKTTLAEIDKNLDGRLYKKDGELTPYGKYVTRIIMPDIMKFGVVNALFPDANYKNPNELRTKGLVTLGISGTSEEDEATKLLSAFNSGVKKIDADKKTTFAKDIAKRFSNIKLNDLKLAEAVAEQTGAGLNWRFDAAKDVGDLDKVRAKNPGVTFEKCWSDTIEFWTDFIQNAKKENNSTYTIAEVTNLHDFFDWSKAEGAENKKNFGKFINPHIAERAFYEQTGATTGSNFSIFFGLFPEIFGQNPEHGTSSWRFGKAGPLLWGGLGDFLKPKDDASGSMAESLQFINQNHIFVGNHDKPRPLHTMAVNMELFLADKIKVTESNGNAYALYNNGDLADKGEAKFKEIVEKNKDAYNRATGGRTDYDNISCMAVAVGDKYFEYFDKVMANYSDKDREIVHKAIIDLVNGTGFKDRAKFNKAVSTKNHTELAKYLEKARAFGDAPFEVTMKEVMKQAKYIAKNEYNLDKWLPFGAAQEIVDKTFDSMMKTPMQKMSSMWEMMCGLVGIPTLFSGDEMAQTGYEWPTKNGELGIRNLIHHDWLNPNNKSKKAIQEYNQKMMQITKLHKDKTRNLSALANGDPVSLQQANSDEMHALYKSNYKGSAVISVFTDAQFEGKTKNDEGKNTVATIKDLTEPLIDPEKAIKQVPFIELKDDNGNNLLPEGTTFKKLRYDKEQGKYVDDNNWYVVKTVDGKHVLANKDGSDVKLEGTTNFFYKTYEPGDGKVYKS